MSGVSGQLITFIDRGHFVMEQLLKGKYTVEKATNTRELRNTGKRGKSRISKEHIVYLADFTRIKRARCKIVLDEGDNSRGYL